MFSVLILTKNESINIGECIKSCACSDDIVVFDSFSDDNTVEIATGLGARVIQRVFDGYGSQREAARNVLYKYPWVLAIDADERPDAELVEELMKLSELPIGDVSAYRVRRKDYLHGRWIKYSSLYPSWFVRFYRPEAIYYESRAVHEYPETDGNVGLLNGHLLHYSFSKGLDEWFLKHVKYAKLEASENVKSLSKGSVGFDVLGLASLDPIRRRKALKQLSFRLPMRPQLRFLYSFVFRGGFLDGIEGYRYAKMLAIYEQMIVLNMVDMKIDLHRESVNVY